MDAHCGHLLAATPYLIPPALRLRAGLLRAEHAAQRGLQAGQEATIAQRAAGPLVPPKRPAQFLVVRPPQESRENRENRGQENRENRGQSPIFSAGHPHPFG